MTGRALALTDAELELLMDWYNTLRVEALVDQADAELIGKIREARYATVNDKQKSVVLVLDETGSMNRTADDTRGAVNSYFEKLAEEAPEAVVSVMEFSDNYNAEPVFRTLVSSVPVASVPKLTEENYRPRGDTPLYDAIGKAIVETAQVPSERYTLVIMTDGRENASKEWTLPNVRSLIEEKQQAGNWTIVYLGANQDAWAVGGAMGIRSGNTMTYTQTGTGVRATATNVAVATATRLSEPEAATFDFFADAGQTAKDYEDPGAAEEKPLWSKDTQPGTN